MSSDLSTSQQAPQIWNFSEPVQFLRAWFEFQKSQSQDFSYGKWAANMGLKSRSFLRLVLVGKRNLTEDTAELFAKSIKLPSTEKQYFLNLVRLSRATSLKDKEAPSRELNKLRHKFALNNQDIVEIQKKDLFDFLSSYRIPRLQILLTIENLEKTEKNLASLLGVKESEALQMLEILSRLGLAVKLATGQWQAQDSKLMTPDALGNVALQSFHKKSLEEAIQAIDLPTESRRFQSMVLALTQEQFQEVHQEIRQHLEFILQKFESQDGQAKRVYQLNLNIIPVTESIFRDHDRVPMESPVNQEVKNENNN